MIYLDNAATTQPLDEVTEELYRLMRCQRRFGNPSSGHQAGQWAAEAVKKARNAAAQSIGANADEIIFTSGGTESDNFALRGLVPYLRRTGRQTIITSEIEHAAVLRTCEQLERESMTVFYAPVDGEGVIDLQELERIMLSCGKTLGLVSVMAVNNEVGAIQPIREIGAMCRKYGATFHTDAVQAYGHIPLDVDSCNIDLMSISAHKVHGLMGTGILYKRRGVEIAPLMYGGGQENGLRSGTENVFGIAVLPTVVEHIDLNRYAGEMPVLRRQLFRELDRRQIDYRVNCVNGAPHIVSLTLPGCMAEAAVLMLSADGICVSAGSACSGLSLKASHTLQAMGLDEKSALSTIRVSMDITTTVEDLRIFAEKLCECVKILRSLQSEEQRERMN